jgi:membrane associated rhomboid family serine protease
LFEFEKFPETSLRRKFIGGDLRRNTEAPISQFRDELASAIVSVHPIKMNGGPSGFNNAPVTKAFVIATALFTVFFGIRGGSSKLGLSYQDIFEKFRIWKLIISAFAFSSTTQLLSGLYLLYFFRVFERQIGSNKYSVFIFFSGFVSLILETILLSLTKDPTANLLTSGPYALVFASFVPFFLDIPVTKRFGVLGVHFSDKSFIYLAGVQLLLSSWKRSIFTGICGIIAGSLYRLNIFGIRKAKFPEFMASLFSRFSLPSLSSHSQPPRRTSPNLGRQAVRAYRAPMPSTTEPSEEAIATLVSMGFDQNAARQALVHARNDVNAATNILLEAHSH